MSEKRHVVITGASSGIGAALARAFGARGDRLTLVARRRPELEALAAEVGGAHVVPWDLADTPRATEWLPGAVAAQGPVDVLVNNAGVQIIGRSLEQELGALEAMLRLNLETPLRLTMAVAPAMVARKSGTVVDVSSVAALAPTPFMAYYNASKAGLAAASESLRAELRPHGVHVVTVYPGPIDTPMAARGYAVYEDTKAAQAVPLGKPEVLAELVLRAIDRRQPRVVYPRFYALTRHFPGTTRYVLDNFTPRPRAS